MTNGQTEWLPSTRSPVAGRVTTRPVDLVKTEAEQRGADIHIIVRGGGSYLFGQAGQV
ncbi:hypothetical protein ACFVYV_45790 [Streptomyces mirabilis]|uniref:hypothetical protein n=1 Tax=Streptomyces mirabilis TaxID=68239 RepID=UPI0036D89E35